MLKRKGFTLIELSIVLVIIGLVIGGVLMGQNLIEAANVRAQVSQLEKLNTAVRTFRSKYNGLPGDLVDPDSYGLNLSSETGTETDCLNSSSLEGNGQLNDFGGGSTLHYNGEIFNFWIHLTNAKLVEGNYQRVDNDGSPNCYDVGLQLYAGQHYMKSPFEFGVIAVTDDTALHYIVGFYASRSANTNLDVHTAAIRNLSPERAYAIDIKTDDGQPDAGTIRSIERYDSIAPDNAVGFLVYETLDGANECMLGGEYNLTNNTPLCLLSVKAQ